MFEGTRRPKREEAAKERCSESLGCCRHARKIYNSGGARRIYIFRLLLCDDATWLDINIQFIYICPFFFLFFWMRRYNIIIIIISHSVRFISYLDRSTQSKVFYFSSSFLLCFIFFICLFRWLVCCLLVSPPLHHENKLLKEATTVKKCDIQPYYDIGYILREPLLQGLLRDNRQTLMGWRE